jgi:hypothetical protein
MGIHYVLLFEFLKTSVLDLTPMFFVELLLSFPLCLTFKLSLPFLFRLLLILFVSPFPISRNGIRHGIAKDEVESTVWTEISLTNVAFGTNEVSGALGTWKLNFVFPEVDFPMKCGRSIKSVCFTQRSESEFPSKASSA